ncbi:MAG: ATP synthase F1 subunit gamma [Bacteroidota bacterium]
MANLRDIRNRIASIQNTQQITRAMKMVAAAKLRKAQNRIIENRPYANKMKQVVSRLVANAQGDHQLLQAHDSVDHVLFIVVGSDRGLCGAFNNNLFKEVEQRIETDFADHKKNGTLSMVTIGRKAHKHFGKRNYNVIKAYDGFFKDLLYNEGANITSDAIDGFVEGTFDEVYFAYNEFKSVLAQNRIVEQLLPIDPTALLNEQDEAQKEEGSDIDYIFEPDVEQILDRMLPLHLKVQLWKGILESNAAEQGARMTAMDNATENAKELERDLKLEYNQARQSAITTEISEIVSGAQALEEA